jgi:hypothetical protein
MPEPGWDDYVGIAFERVIDAAEGSRAVLQRIRDALDGSQDLTGAMELRHRP